MNVGAGDFGSASKAFDRQDGPALSILVKVYENASWEHSMIKYCTT